MTEEKKEPSELDREIQRLKQENVQLKKDLEEKARAGQAAKKRIMMSDLEDPKFPGSLRRPNIVISTTNPKPQTLAQTRDLPKAETPEEAQDRILARVKKSREGEEKTK